MEFKQYLEQLIQKRFEETPINVDPSAAAPGKINVTLTNQANGKVEKFRVDASLTIEAFMNTLVSQGWGLKTIAGIAPNTTLAKIAKEELIEFDAMNTVLTYKPTKETVKDVAATAPKAAPTAQPAKPAPAAPAKTLF